MIGAVHHVISEPADLSSARSCHLRILPIDDDGVKQNLRGKRFRTPVPPTLSRTTSPTTTCVNCPLYFKDKDDVLVACTEEYIARHRRQAEAILASDVPAGDKLRRYVLDRFRAAQGTRTGYRHAAELTREVLRVRPDRRLDEGRMMWENFVRILRLGLGAGELYTDDPERDARVLLLSLAFLFPSAFDEMAYSPKEADLLLVVDWFLGVWGRQAARPARRKRGGR